MEAKWNGIEKVLNAGTLEDQDRETLRAFAKVEPPPSRNPAFHDRGARPEVGFTESGITM